MFVCVRAKKALLIHKANSDTNHRRKKNGLSANKKMVPKDLPR